MGIHVESDTVSAVGRAWHDISVGAIVGSNLFAQVGWHPALRAVSDERERGRVTNEAWRRYGVVNGFALLGIVSGWVGARAFEAQPNKLTERERRIATAKDALTGVIAVTGLASAALGMRFYEMADEGAVPMRDGDSTSPQADPAATRLKRALSALSRIQLASALTLGVVQAGMAQVNYRRPPLKRLLRRTH
jgi:hypothetical protein